MTKSSNKKRLIMLVLLLLITLSVNIHTINKHDEEVIIKEGNEITLDELKGKKKSGISKIKRPKFLKIEFPDSDVENSLLSFSNELERLSKEVAIDLNDINVNMESLRTKGKLVFIELNVKANGSSIALSQFMNFSKQNEFTHIRQINTRYNRDKDKNEILVKYELIAHVSNQVNKITKPDELINRETIYRNIMGEWVDFFTYKKQMKELEKYGHIRNEKSESKSQTTKSTSTTQTIKETKNTSDNKAYVEVGSSPSGYKEVIIKEKEQVGPTIKIEGFDSEDVKAEIINPTKPEEVKPTPKPKAKPTKIIDSIKFINPTEKLDIIKNFSDEYNGIDIGIKSGTNIMSVTEGKVIFAGDMEPHGNTVIIDHGNNIKSLYGNLSEILVGDGEAIKKGTTVGLSGQLEGLEFYHFKLADGDFIDPTKYIKEN